MSAGLTVGVLALQGDFREHLAVLQKLGADAIPVRRPADLDRVSGIVIPGGESSVIDKLSRQFGMREPLQERIRGGLPTYGTCAGLIMLAHRILDGIEGQLSLDVLDVDVRRNAFGSQVDSFETHLDVTGIEGDPMHAVFIRAPIVERVGDGVEVLARVSGGDAEGRVVAVQSGSILGTSFHPEITDDLRIHERFLALCRAV